MKWGEVRLVLSLLLFLGISACAASSPREPDFGFEGAIPLQGMLTYKP